ncbi:GNAT family N-acetyltransferase [Cryptosporangium arvum]|uniref:GNAT family N-acetyltransferase n=1 Tax=Cryptosporangium arvum TaxID=80871 RepID=UPI0004BCA830|nr:GNAT family N-acetyltransferase [Cryptosporangium arvum]
MRLRNVRRDDVDAYRRMRCDPVMMAELGGPQPVETIPPKVESDVRAVEADEYWVSMITPDDSDEALGSVTLWSHADHGERISEVGWLVLPEHQGRGVGKWGVRTVLDRAAADGRWGAVHAFPAVTNAPSNGICRTLGFRLLGVEVIPFGGREFTSNHWVFDESSAARI